MHLPRGPPTPSLLLLWPALPGAALVALVRVAFHYGGGHLARRLAVRLHGPQWRDKLKPNAPEEFAERIFYAVGHTLCTAIGGWVCWRNGWFGGPGELFFALPFPHELPPEQVNPNPNPNHDPNPNLSLTLTLTRSSWR